VQPTNYNTGLASFSSGFVLVRHRLQIPKKLIAGRTRTRSPRAGGAAVLRLL
jgi:hypothetical protein